MKVKYLSLAVAAALSSQVLADDIQELATTEVSAKTNKQQVITAERLANLQVNDVKGTLQQLAGVDVSNSVRYSQKVYLRGLEEHSANVTIDGARQDGQMFHHASNQVIDPAILKSATVELGATSVLSGYGANTGAVRYETKDPQDMLAADEQFGARVSLAADDATEFRQANVTGYGRLTEQLSVLAYVNYNESGDIETPDAAPIVSKHSELKSGLFKAVYDFSDTEQLEFSAQYAEDGGRRNLSGEKPGATSLEQALGFHGYERDTYTLGYQNSSDDPLLDLAVNVYANEKRLVREPIVQGASAYPEREYSYTTYGLDANNTFIINDIAWTAGIETFKAEQDIKVDGFRVNTLEDGSTEQVDINIHDEPTASLVAGYVQAELNFGDVTVVPGVRYDSYSLGGAYDLSFNKLSPKLAVDWQANKDLNLKLGYGRIFKGPALAETLTLGTNIQQADNVAAETGNHVEFNIIQDLAEQLSVDSAKAYVNLFHYAIDNYYHPTKNTSLAGGRFDLEVDGVEAGFNVSHEDLTAYINYSYNTGDNEYPGYTTDHLYAGTQVVKLGLDYQVNNALVVGFNSYFASNADLDRNSLNGEGQVETEEVKKAGYGVTNLWLAYDVEQVEGLIVRLGVDNVFDKAYQNHNSFGMYWGNADYNDNEVGRNIKVGVSYQF
ncbi:TonB-dependent receptor [Thalassotalea euphylliae]|uniref:TonB-dependent receptor n=1 Tax=Thalassotalea euphylliae TaxID=1655234 RepID=A0A3E0TSF6_9GAMM|nr:TonB-dependent receptor [Thalassotalea euphylliae]REL26912.1 TonB-dependent receptor [Thalassotalea euphylliae]